MPRKQLELGEERRRIFMAEIPMKGLHTKSQETRRKKTTMKMNW
jgi:hypothetical protein